MERCNKLISAQRTVIKHLFWQKYLKLFRRLEASYKNLIDRYPGKHWHNYTIFKSDKIHRSFYSHLQQKRILRNLFKNIHHNNNVRLKINNKGLS